MMAEKIKISGIKITSGKYMLTIGSVLSLFVFGLFDSLKGSTISALLGEPGFSYSLGGIIVMRQYAGYFAATFLAGRMLDRFGHKMNQAATSLLYIIRKRKAAI